MFRRTCLVLAALGTLALPAQAQDALTDADRAAIAARAASYERLTMARDVAGMIAKSPPSFFSEFAERNGITEAEARDVVMAQVSATPSAPDVHVDSVDVDLDAAQVLTTPDGSRLYAVIPVVMALRGLDGTRGRLSTQLVALQDGGDWYVVQVDGADNAATLRTAFPEFEGVPFPESVLEVVE